jgi:hypothetical protein
MASEPDKATGEVLEAIHVVRDESDAPIDLTRAQQERASAKRVEAMSLRLAGLTWEQIGDRLQISTEAARQIVQTALDRATHDRVEALREIENARLDRAQAAIWTKVLEGDLKAVDTFLRISQRRSKMNGLDAPTKIDLGVTIKQEMEAALQELEAVVMGEVISVSRADERIGPPPLDA